MMDDDPWPELNTRRDRIIEILDEADDSLTTHQINGKLIGKLSEREMMEELDQLKEEGVVEEGPPETASGIMGLVDRKPTYRIKRSEDG